MEVTLNGTVYAVVLDMRGRRLVIERRSPRLWRVADPRTTLRVLAGLSVPMLRLVR